MLISYILLCKCCFHIVRKLLLLAITTMMLSVSFQVSSSSDAFANSFFLFQMADIPPRQIVRLTRCIAVRGHPATLIEMMSFVGYRWYPKYTVEEQFRDFNQTQYHCIIRIYPHHIGVTQPILFGHDIGITENMVVQDVAYTCITLLREEHALLQDTSFRYIPAALPGEDGYYTGLYTDHSLEDPLLQTTAQFSRDRDRDARALRFRASLHS